MSQAEENFTGLFQQEEGFIAGTLKTLYPQADDQVVKHIANSIRVLFRTMFELEEIDFDVAANNLFKELHHNVKALSATTTLEAVTQAVDDIVDSVVFRLNDLLVKPDATLGNEA